MLEEKLDNFQPSAEILIVAWLEMKDLTTK